MYNEGISKTGDLLDVAVEHEIIQKRGAFYTFGDTRLGQGRENAKAFLQESPDLFWQIDGLARDKSGLPHTLVTGGDSGKIVQLPQAAAQPAGKAKSTPKTSSSKKVVLDDDTGEDLAEEGDDDMMFEAAA